MGWWLVVLGWAQGWWWLWQLPAPGRRSAPPGDGDGGGGAGGRPGPIAVVVPARNEAATLARLLPSLATQSIAATVVVVDDGSTDGTAEVARRAGATVLVADEPPAGWTGKTWAAATGAAHAVATGAALLVFIDADVVLAPDALARVVTELDLVGGLVSVQPFHEPGPGAEQLALCFNVVSLLAAGAFSPLGGQARVAFGPLVACTTADYGSVGGHAAVRGSVIEDVALAQRFAAHGLAVHGYAGRSTVRFRMYPDGFGALVEGFTKNLASGAGAVPWWRSLLAFAWVAAAISAVLGAITGAIEGDLVPAIAYLAFVVQLAWIARRIGRFRWWAIVGFPGPLAVFVAVCARSLVRTVIGRQVTWKGRSIAIEPRGRRR